MRIFDIETPKKGGKNGLCVQDIVIESPLCIKYKDVLESGSTASKVMQIFLFFLLGSYSGVWRLSTHDFKPSVHQEDIEALFCVMLQMRTVGDGLAESPLPTKKKKKMSARGCSGSPLKCKCAAGQRREEKKIFADHILSKRLNLYSLLFSSGCNCSRDE